MEKSPTQRIYLDHAATTPVDPMVFEEMQPYFVERFGNPSVLYSYGQETKDALERARGKVAQLIGALPEEIIFTSGGTESSNWALRGVTAAYSSRGNHVITSQIEHPAILNCCKYLEQQGVKVAYLPVDSYGQVDPEDVRRAITPKTVLISIMHANNEIGTIEPIEKIAAISQEHGVLFHTDAVQTVGILDIDVKEIPVDLLTFSSHKLYGPKGVGALYLRQGTRIAPLLHGGEQELNRRAGTENVPGAVGFGKACELAAQEAPKEREHLIKLRDMLIQRVDKEVGEVTLNGHPRQRLPGNVHLTFHGVEAEALLLNLDAVGVCASAGSACASRALEPSHVLAAIGLPRRVADCSVRFSLGRGNTEEDIDYLVNSLQEIVPHLRTISARYSDLRTTS